MTYRPHLTRRDDHTDLPPVASLDAIAETIDHLQRAAEALRRQPAGPEHSYVATLRRRLIAVRAQLDHPGTHGRADVDSVTAAHRIAREVERYLDGRTTG